MDGTKETKRMDKTKDTTLTEPTGWNGTLPNKPKLESPPILSVIRLYTSCQILALRNTSSALQVLTFGSTSIKGISGFELLELLHKYCATEIYTYLI